MFVLLRHRRDMFLSLNNNVKFVSVWFNMQIPERYLSDE